MLASRLRGTAGAAAAQLARPAQQALMHFGRTRYAGQSYLSKIDNG
jgi:hypothetical protein